VQRDAIELSIHLIKEVIKVRILITGAAKGLGRGMSLAFAKKGHELVLVDIDRNALEQTVVEIEHSGAKCHHYVVDVSNHGQVNELAGKVTSEVGGIDMLINNAGVVVVGEFLDVPIEEWERIMSINFWGTVYMIMAFLPEMVKRGSGHVVNMSSMGGLAGSPAETHYGASKFAVAGMSEALYNEVANKGIRVTIVCPSPIETTILRNARYYGFDRGYEQEVWSFWSTPFDKGIAEIVRGIEKGKFLVIPGRLGKVAYYGRRISQSAYLSIRRNIYGKVLKHRVS
jgi:short-subunit dehydrogenase